MTAFEPPADAITITFPQPAALLNMNSRAGWRAQIRPKRTWRTAAEFAALWHSKPVHAPNGKHIADELVDITGQPPSFVLLELHFATNRRRDPANYYATVKPVVDGLVDAGLWPDDTPEYVTTLEPRLRHSPDRLVTIHIWPRDGAA